MTTVEITSPEGLKGQGVYLDRDFRPVGADEAELIKVFWEDGSVSFLTATKK
jgi:hypothetical protein